MQYYKNILCFEVGWLVDNQITTRTNYDNLAKRKQIQVIRRASRNTPALVVYDSMPDRFKEAIIEKIGDDPYKLVKLNALEDLIEHNTEASKFFNEDFKLSDGRWLPKQTRNEYYHNTIILDAITKLIEKVAVKRAKGHKTGGQWNYFSELVQGLYRTQYPHTLPDYFSSLREKYNKYITVGYISLIHANFLKGIRNATKIDDKVKLNFIITFLKDPRNLDNEQVARVYNEIAGRMNWRKITGHTVAKYRDEYDLEIHAGRRGSVSLYNNKAMQVKREAQFASNGEYSWSELEQVKTNVELAKAIKDITGDAPGIIKEWAGAPGKVPTDYLLCDGRDLSISDYPSLYDAIGVTFGGDGLTTFKLPNAGGLFTVGYSGNGDYGKIGQTGGEDKHLLTIGEMPRHNPANNKTFNKLSARAADVSEVTTPGSLDQDYADREYNVGNMTTQRWDEATIKDIGNDEPHENRPPYIVFAKIIKVR